jgi:hypothetical protein
MQIDLELIINHLGRTPELLKDLLSEAPETAVYGNEGPGTWTPFDVVGHLIHAEITDCIPRAKIILQQGESRPFDPFDREAMLECSKGKTLNQLLEEFAELRKKNIVILREMNLSPDDFSRKGTHPALGTVTLGQLLATWVVHDLDHVNQIIRVTAKQFGSSVGPWEAYLSVLSERRERRL